MNDASTYQLRWPFSAAATFVGIMWVAYGWSIWIGGGIDPEAGDIGIGSIRPQGYWIAGALDTDAVIEDHEWERLVSAIFLHGGFIHILLNSAVILQLGRVLEAFTTRGRCWFTLLFSGLCGSIATLAWAQITHASISSVGASGAGCGLGTALIVLSRGIEPLSEFRKQMITWVIVVLGMGLMPMISGSGHAGGAIGGALAGLLIVRRGSLRLAVDPYARALDAATVLLTIAFIAALATDVRHAPERQAALDEVDSAIADIYQWLNAGQVPNSPEWRAHLEGLTLPAQFDAQRHYLLDIVESIRNHDGGKVSPRLAEEVRMRLAPLRGG